MKILLAKRWVGVSLLVGLVLLICVASLQIWSSLQPAKVNNTSHNNGEHNVLTLKMRSTSIPAYTPTPTATPQPTPTLLPTQPPIPTLVPTQPAPIKNPPVTGGARDVAYWPYAANSPWNTPIGSAAQFETPTSPNWSNANRYGLIMSAEPQYSMAVYIAKGSDPIRTVHRSSNGDTFQLHVPDNMVVGKNGDDELAIIDENHQWVTEMIQAEILPNGDLQAPFPNKIDLRGPGISDHYIGANAYGGSTLAGMIRQGEITNGIHHALRMSLETSVLNWSAPNGQHHVWPASSEDGGGNYPGTGNIYIGSLLAIPQSVDLSTISAPGTPLYNLAKAFQDYGVYITDRGQLNLYAEPSAASEVQGLQYNNVLAPYLKVVTNNTPGSVGGGGNPIVPLAPPINN